MDKKMRKSEIKLRKKLKKFYWREIRYTYFKVSNEFLSYIKDESELAFMLNPISQEKRKGNAKDVIVKLGYDSDDFIMNRKTVRIEYTFPKYGNL